MKRTKRIISALLCVALVGSNLPVYTVAEDLSDRGLCDHHIVHENCGYQEAVIGTACSHEHTEECYIRVIDCAHQHRECTYAEDSDENTCDHQCTAETRCVSDQLTCNHSHDDKCGYAEPKEASPCTYVCEECIKQEQPVCTGALDCPVTEHNDGCEKKAADEKAAEDRAAADAVATLIEDLPSLEEIQAKSVEEQQEYYNQVQIAYEGYCSLTADQQTLLPSAEEIFKPYFDYFNEQLSTAATSGNCGTNLTWQYYYNTRKLVISGTGEMCFTDGAWSTYREDIKTVDIEMGVTSIANDAFNQCTSLMNVTIPESVTSIGERAFMECSSLTSVSLGDQVSYIGDCAFDFCNNLNSIWVNENNQNYSSDSNGVLFNKDKTLLVKVPGGISGSYTIPDCVTHIDDYAVRACGKLSGVTIPDSVTSIGYCAFERCESLPNVTIPDSVVTIGECAFASCSALANVTISNAVTTIGDYTFYDCSGLTGVTIPVGVTTIGECTFARCSGLTSVTLPDTVKAIEKQAFANCNILEEVYYGGSETQWNVISIGLYNDYLTNATIHYTDFCVSEHVYGPDHVCSRCGIIGGICGKNLTWKFDDFAGVLTVSGTGPMDDWGYTDTNDFVLPPWAEYSDAIETVIIEDGVTTIGAAAFYECSSLTDVTVPDSVTTIGIGAFNACTTLESILIPENVVSIGDYAFTDCISLKSISLPQRLESIGFCAFASCYSLTEISIPQSVISIGGYVFDSCESLKRVSIPRSVTSISDGMFGYCESLTSVSIPDSVNAIGDSAFNSCSSLTSVTIPGSVSSIGERVFEDCTNLASVIMLNGVSSIGESAFYSCSSLTSITIPGSVSLIGDYAFTACSQVTDVYYGGDIEQWKILGDYRPEADYVHYSCTDSEGHWNPAKINATCQGDGYTCDSCICGYERNKVITETKLDHKYSAEVTPPTCAKEGYTTHICSGCGDSYTDTPVAKINHTEVIDVAIVPTCTKTGLTQGSHCSVCGTILVVQDVLPYKHNYSNGICTLCGESSAIQGICGMNVFWKLEDNSILHIYGTGAMSNYWLNQPWLDYKTKSERLLWIMV